MRKIINGKMYNTATARLVGEYENGYYRNDFNWYEEQLYRKKTGEFFKYGRGNAMSPYAERCMGGMCGGEKIVPISEEDAREFAEKKLTVEEYIEAFGEVEE